MLTRWSDIDRDLVFFDEFRRRMERLFDDFDGADGRSLLAEGPDRAYRGSAFPRVALADADGELVLTAEVPGLDEKALQITVSQDVVALQGERRVEPIEGFAPLRRERAAARFARTFTLPCRVDAERSSATVKNGVLTIRLAKEPAARPRQIAVRAQ
jgi:HSP20 family protein